MMRRLSVAVVGMWLGCTSVQAQQAYPAGANPMATGLPPAIGMPPPGGTTNPYLAQAIVRKLQESGKLSHYRINVVAQDSVVDLTGELADENQREVMLRLLRTVPGITVLRDYVQIRQERITPPEYQLPAPAPAQAPVMQAQALPGPNQPPMPIGPPAPVGGKPPERIDGQLEAPMPIFQAPLGPNASMQPPPLPPYAWPTVAPYNNYSRVAYPNAYPYEQWPFIGPMYPFPRVPLGWRSVSLTWEDGSWWFHRNPTGHDWWRVRYH